MSGNLVVNPYLQIQPIAGTDSEFLLLAPKPGEGLHTVPIARAKQENIFEVFSDLAKTRFDFLDTELDLGESERELLFDGGVLVDAGTRPEKPLFGCNLEDVQEFGGDFDPANLIANPTFRFEPFDLAKFAILAQEKHLSPNRPSVWIRSAVSEIEMGYWLLPDDAESISRMKADARPETAIDEKLLRKLLTAGIVGSPEQFQEAEDRWNNIIGAAKTKYAADKYAVLRGIFPPEQMQAMRQYYRRYVDNGFMPFGDSQVERRYRQHNEPFASFLHGQFSKLMSMIVGDEVKLSYVYAASYKEGSILTPHTDREQCEYSISFQVDYQPEPPDNISPWAIFVEPLKYSGELQQSGLTLEWEQLDEHRGESPKPSPLHLASGDGLIYKGRELIHYRRELPHGHRSTSLFFHFVAKDFEGRLN